MQPFFIRTALYGWTLVVLYLFQRLPKHRALIISILAGTMFLPEVQIAKVSGQAPDAFEFVLLILKFTKPNAICFAALLGVILYDFKQLLTFRLRWFDVPMLVYCGATFISNLTNGVAPYDSFAMMRDKTLTWFVPYFLGRIYFRDLEKFRDLAVGIVIAGIAYAPLCLWESRMFPNLHLNLYGFFPGPENEVFRWGGYRPVVFMSHGIMLGLWMVATTVVGFWLWWTGAVAELTIWPFRRPIGMKKLMIFLGLTTVWVRSTGAIAIGAACLLGTAQMRWIKFPVILILLLVISPLYLSWRMSGWTGESFTEGLKDLGMGADRVGSLEYRLHMENRLILHYQRKPEFGWGDFKEDWRKAPKLDKDDYPMAVADAMWIINLVCYGYIGLIAVWTAMLLPVVRFMIAHPPRTWFNPALAPAAAATLLLIMYMIDNLFNAFYNAVFILVAGALASLTGVRVPSGAPVEQEPETAEPPPPEPSKFPRGRPGVLMRQRPPHR